jgi:hypothetical protein
MKPTPLISTARNAAGTNRHHLRCPKLSWPLAGVTDGVAGASAYLLLGGEYLWDIPRWAMIVFLPGLLAGNAVYQWGLSRVTSKVVGVPYPGLSYAALAGLARLGWCALHHRRQAAPARRTCK